MPLSHAFLSHRKNSKRNKKKARASHGLTKAVFSGGQRGVQGIDHIFPRWMMMREILPGFHFRRPPGPEHMSRFMGGRSRMVRTFAGHETAPAFAKRPKQEKHSGSTLSIGEIFKSLSSKRPLETDLRRQ